MKVSAYRFETEPDPVNNAGVASARSLLDEDVERMSEMIASLQNVPLRQDQDPS